MPRALALLVLTSLLASTEPTPTPAPRDILWTEKKLYSHSNEEVIIRDFFQDRRDGFFVDIGCSHPRRNSNTYYLEKHLGWTGIGVDGLPNYAKGWAKVRPESTFLNFLVTDESGTEKTFYQVPEWGLSTAEEDVAKHLKVVKEIEVPTRTLDDILEAQKVEHIDLLSIDVEGHYEEVLGGFDLERWRPELVCIEEQGPFAVPWFRARGYEPIARYRARDAANWYFAPRDVARAVGARESEEGRRIRREQREYAERLPPGSDARLYVTRKYVLDRDGELVLNPEWAEQSALANERKAAGAITSPREAESSPPSSAPVPAP